MTLRIRIKTIITFRKRRREVKQKFMQKVWCEPKTITVSNRRNGREKKSSSNKRELYNFSCIFFFFRVFLCVHLIVLRFSFRLQFIQLLCCVYGIYDTSADTHQRHTTTEAHWFVCVCLRTKKVTVKQKIKKNKNRNGTKREIYVWFIQTRRSTTSSSSQHTWIVVVIIRNLNQILGAIQLKWKRLQLDSISSWPDFQVNIQKIHTFFIRHHSLL